MKQMARSSTPTEFFRKFSGPGMLKQMARSSTPAQFYPKFLGAVAIICIICVVPFLTPAPTNSGNEAVDAGHPTKHHRIMGREKKTSVAPLDATSVPHSAKRRVMRREPRMTEAPATTLAAPQSKKKHIMRREQRKIKGLADLKTALQPKKGQLMRREPRKTPALTGAETSHQPVKGHLMRREPRKTMAAPQVTPAGGEQEVMSENRAAYFARVPLLFLFGTVATIGIAIQAKGALVQILSLTGMEKSLGLKAK